MPDGILELFSNPGPGQFVVEGRWCIEALLEADGFEVTAVLRAEGAYSEFEERYLHLADIYTVPKDQLSAVMGFAFHRGVLALAKRPQSRPIEPSRLSGVVVACPCLADEFNLGAIIRSAAALGASALLVPKNSGADVYSRKSIRSSSGAVFRLPVFECTNLLADIGVLKECGFSILATSLDEDSLSLQDLPSIEDAVVLFGPEKGGLGGDWLDLCDVKLKIPMAGGMDSLNVAASAAIVLYQLSIGRRT